MLKFFADKILRNSLFFNRLESLPLQLKEMLLVLFNFKNFYFKEIF